VWRFLKILHGGRRGDIEYPHDIIGAAGRAVFVLDGRLDCGVVQLIEQPLGHSDLRIGCVHGNTSSVIICRDNRDIRDSADDGSDFLKLLDGRGVGQVEGAVAVLTEDQRSEGEEYKDGAHGVPFRTLDAARRANVQMTFARR